MAKNRRQKRKRASARERAEKHTSEFQGTAIRRPDGMELFKVKKGGQYRLEIIPYIVKEDGVNPYATEADMLAPERTFFVHRGIGATQDTYVCPAKTAGKKCPICDEVARMKRDPDHDKDLVKALRPKERQLWLVLDRAEEEKGVQLWDISNFLFGKLVDDEVNNSDEEDGWDYYFDEDEGLTLRVSFSEESFEGNSFCKATSLNFINRKRPVPSELYDHGVCLDELLIFRPYDELQKIFLQEEGEDDDGKDDEDRPTKGRSGRKQDKKSTKSEPSDDEPSGRNDTTSDGDDGDDAPTPKPKKEKKGKKEKKPKKDQPMTADEAGLAKGDAVTYKGQACEIAKISGDGTSLTPIDDDDEIIKAVGCDEVKQAKPAKASDDDEDDDIPFDGDESPDDDPSGGGEDWDDDWDDD